MTPTRNGFLVGLVVAAALGAGALLGYNQLHSGASSIMCRGRAAGWTGRVSGPRLAAAHPADEAAIARLVNAYRAQHHLLPLAVSAALGYAARYHSADEHARAYFAHERRGETFAGRFARYTPSTCIAENLAWGTVGFGTPAGIVSLWRSSPGHRHVMLLPWVRRIGVGIVVGSFQGQRHAHIVTADFSS